MGSPTPIAYPESEQRTARRFRVAAWTIVPGFALLGTAVVLLSLGVGGTLELVLWFVAAAGGATLLLVGFGLSILAQFQSTRELIGVARARTAPEGPPVLDTAPARGEIRAGVVLTAGNRDRSNSAFLAPVVFACVVATAVVVGLASLLLGRFPPSSPAILLLILSALLVPALLAYADVNRAPPGRFEETATPSLFVSAQGVEGPFYPYAAYQQEPDGSSIRSPWFRIVQARLPAPNRVPWRLLSVTVGRTHDARTPALSFVSLTPAQIPWWMGGLKLGPGFLPAGTVGDGTLGFGLVLAVWRSQLDQVLWMALLGGSRLFTEHSQLTDAGRAAVKSGAGLGNSWMNRPLNGPWFVSLPRPSSVNDLSAWLT